MSLEQNWIEFSKKVLEQDHTRWRNTKQPILEGEIKYLLSAHGLTPYSQRVINIAAVVKNISYDKTAFYVNEDKRIYSANLGKLIECRTQGLQDPDKKADEILKMWLKSETEDFINKHLPRLLSYNLSLNNKVTIPLNNLLQLADNWEHKKTENITEIASNYHSTKHKGTK